MSTIALFSIALFALFTIVMSLTFITFKLVIKTRELSRTLRKVKKEAHMGYYKSTRLEKNYRRFRVQFDYLVDAISKSRVFDDSNQTLQEIKDFSPPVTMPKDLRMAYTMDRQIPVEYDYRDSRPRNMKPKIYDYKTVDTCVQQVQQRIPGYTRYGKTNDWLYEALEKHPIQGKSLVIMGSNKPWYEGVGIAFGADVTTIEYNRIISEHPKLKTITPDEYEANPIRFDAGFSVSSFEHDGLGRYGDPINPVADMEAMKKMKSIIKPGGILFLAIPVGQDRIIWNKNRIYGKLRLPLMLEGWKTLETYGYEESQLDQRKNSFEPVFVLENSI